MITERWTIEWNDLDINLDIGSIYSHIHFMFRPHQLLFHNLIDKKLLTIEEKDNVIKAFESNINATFDNRSVKADYMIPFSEANA